MTCAVVARVANQPGVDDDVFSVCKLRVGLGEACGSLRACEPDSGLTCVSSCAQVGDCPQACQPVTEGEKGVCLPTTGGLHSCCLNMGINTDCGAGLACVRWPLTPANSATSFFTCERRPTFEQASIALVPPLGTCDATAACTGNTECRDTQCNRVADNNAGACLGPFFIGSPPGSIGKYEAGVGECCVRALFAGDSSLVPCATGLTCVDVLITGEDVFSICKFVAGETQECGPLHECQTGLQCVTPCALDLDCSNACNPVGADEAGVCLRADRGDGACCVSGAGGTQTTFDCRVGFLCSRWPHPLPSSGRQFDTCRRRPTFRPTAKQASVDAPLRVEFDTCSGTEACTGLTECRDSACNKAETGTCLAPFFIGERPSSIVDFMTGHLGQCCISNTWCENDLVCLPIPSVESGTLLRQSSAVSFDTFKVCKEVVLEGQRCDGLHACVAGTQCLATDSCNVADEGICLRRKNTNGPADTGECCNNKQHVCAQTLECTDSSWNTARLCTTIATLPPTRRPRTPQPPPPCPTPLPTSPPTPLPTALPVPVTVTPTAMPTPYPTPAPTTTPPTRLPTPSPTPMPVSPFGVFTGYALWSVPDERARLDIPYIEDKLENACARASPGSRAGTMSAVTQRLVLYLPETNDSGFEAFLKCASLGNCLVDKRQHRCMPADTPPPPPPTPPPAAPLPLPLPPPPPRPILFPTLWSYPIASVVPLPSFSLSSWALRARPATHFSSFSSLPYASSFGGYNPMTVAAGVRAPRFDDTRIATTTVGLGSGWGAGFGSGGYYALDAGYNSVGYGVSSQTWQQLADVVVTRRTHQPKGSVVPFANPTAAPPPARSRLQTLIEDIERDADLQPISVLATSGFPISQLSNEGYPVPNSGSVPSAAVTTPALPEDRWRWPRRALDYEEQCYHGAQYAAVCVLPLTHSQGWLLRYRVAVMNALAVEAFDVDGDGDLDIILLMGGRDSVLWVLLGDGQGAFSDGGFTQLPSWATCMDAYDMDNTGTVSVAVGCADSVVVLTGDGRGGWGPQEELLANEPGPVISVLFSDVQINGPTSLVVHSQGLVSFSVFHQRVSPMVGARFEPEPEGFQHPRKCHSTARSDVPGQFLAACGVFTHVIGVDIDRDGKEEEVLVERNTGGLRVDFSEGSRRGQSVFYTPTTDDVAFGLTAVLAAADFNGDGWPDLALSQEGSSDVLLLEYDRHQHRLSDSPLRLPTGATNGMVVGDFDNNGTPDLVVISTRPGTLSTWLNLGEETLERMTRW